LISNKIFNIKLIIQKDKDKYFLKEINITIQKQKDLKIQVDLLQTPLKFKTLSKSKLKMIRRKPHNHERFYLAWANNFGNKMERKIHQQSKYLMD